MNITYCMFNNKPIILGIDNQSIIQIYKSRGLKGLSFRMEDGYLEILTNEPTGIPTRLGEALNKDNQSHSWTPVENYTTHEWFQELQDFYNQCLNSYQKGDIIGNEINPKDATLSIDSSFLSVDIDEPAIPDAQSIQEYRESVNTTINAQEIVEPTINLHLYCNNKPSTTQAQLIKNTIISLTSLQVAGSVKQFPPNTQNPIEYVTNLKPTLPPNTHAVCFMGNEIETIKLYCDMYGYEFPKYLEPQEAPAQQEPQVQTEPITVHSITSNTPNYTQELVKDIIGRLGNPTFNGNTNVSITLQGSVSGIVAELQDRLSKNEKLSSKAERFIYIQGVNYNSDLHLALQVYNTMYSQNIVIPQLQEQAQQEQQPQVPSYNTVLVVVNAVDYGNNIVQELQTQLNATFTIIANIDNYSVPSFDANTVASHITQALQQSNNTNIERVIFIAGTDYNSDLNLALQVYNTMYNQEQPQQ